MWGELKNDSHRAEYFVVHLDNVEDASNMLSKEKLTVTNESLLNHYADIFQREQIQF